MAIPANDMSQRLAATVNHLRMVQISCAEDDQEKRSAYLQDILRRSVESVLPEQRRDFLGAVKNRFPSWDTTSAPASPQDADAALGEDTPESLAARLVDFAQFLDDEEREAVATKLRSGGFGTQEAEPAPAAATPGDPVVLPERTQKALQHLMRELGTDRLDLTRLVKLVALLATYAGNSDQVLWNTWRTVAPRSAIRRPCDLRKNMASYVAGSKDVSGVDLKNHVDRLRRLTAAVIAATGQVGTRLSRQHLAKLAPTEIEAHVKREGGGLLASHEYKCWNRYLKLANEISEEHIEHAVKQSVAEFTESLMRQSAEHAEARA